MVDILLFPFDQYWWFYAGFTVFVLAMLALDLGVFHRDAHAVGVREASAWSVAWVVLALAFNYAFYRYASWHPAQVPSLAALDHAQLARDASLEFLAGYVVEKALAVDNIFVFVADLRLFRGAAEVPAPRAVLRDPRRAGLPRAVHLARLGADAVPLGDRGLRRVPDADRREDPVPAREADRARAAIR